MSSETSSEIRVDGVLSDLPMMEILKRLSLKPQARFKCVSKSWYALITSLQNQIFLLKREVTNEETGEIEVKFSILKYPFTADDESSFEHLDHPRFGKEFRDSSVNGHSHGIVCFSHGFFDIFLYNPTTGELRKLPPSILLYPNHTFQGIDSLRDAIGFGYDPISRDFKVVRTVIYSSEINLSWSPTKAEVYDLGKDRWREIKTPVPCIVHSMSSFDMYYQGLFYWWATGEADAEFIQWFDMSKEVFGLISMPFKPRDMKIESLGVLNGSIVLLHYPCDGNEKSFDVWEMVKDDHGEFVSWTKLFTIGPLFGIYRPSTFVSSHEILMEDNEGQLILCNIFNAQCKPLPIKGNHSTTKVLSYVKTLVSVKGGGKMKCLS